VLLERTTRRDSVIRQHSKSLAGDRASSAREKRIAQALEFHGAFPLARARTTSAARGEIVAEIATAGSTRVHARSGIEIRPLA
jgi:hypothetical protein